MLAITPVGLHHNLHFLSFEFLGCKGSTYTLNIGWNPSTADILPRILGAIIEELKSVEVVYTLKTKKYMTQLAILYRQFPIYHISVQLYW